MQRHLSRNRLLATMDAASRARLQSLLQPVDLPNGQVLCESGATFGRVYFPISGVISAVCVFENGAAAEMAMIGCEGMAPTAALLHGETALARHVVQVPGAALAIDRLSFQRAVEESRALRKHVLRYLQAVFVQVQQSVACNAVHSVEQRLARWLLMCHDRAGADTFALTHEFISEMLGVHRLTVNVAARAYQRAGLIHYQRGVVSVLDRCGLERATCECYAIISQQYDRVLPRGAI